MGEISTRKSIDCSFVSRSSFTGFCVTSKLHAKPMQGLGAEEIVRDWAEFS